MEAWRVTESGGRVSGGMEGDIGWRVTEDGSTEGVRESGGKVDGRVDGRV